MKANFSVLMILLMIKHFSYIKANYILRGDDANSKYGLVSSVQIEKGNRLMSPIFGFYYRAKRTRVKVIFLETSTNTQHEIMNEEINTANDEIETANEWKYFFKNMSEVNFISTAWAATDEMEWQVYHVHKDLSNAITILK